MMIQIADTGIGDVNNYSLNIKTAHGAAGGRGGPLFHAAPMPGNWAGVSRLIFASGLNLVFGGFVFYR